MGVTVLVVSAAFPNSHYESATLAVSSSNVRNPILPTDNDGSECDSCTSTQRVRTRTSQKSQRAVSGAASYDSPQRELPLRLFGSLLVLWSILFTGSSSSSRVASIIWPLRPTGSTIS